MKFVCLSFCQSLIPCSHQTLIKLLEALFRFSNMTCSFLLSMYFGWSPAPPPLVFTYPVAFLIITNPIFIPKMTCSTYLYHYFDFRMYDALNCFVIIQIRLKVSESRDSTLYFFDSSINVMLDSFCLIFIGV